MTKHIPVNVSSVVDATAARDSFNEKFLAVITARASIEWAI
jgi:sugar/nucleoside kinase (ribokinase family)